MFEKLPKKVKIVEVGPRDGLQNEKKKVSTEDKLTFIKKLVQAGVKDLEVTSFVSAKAIPQMSDGKTLFEMVKKELGKQKLTLTCLVPNIRGLDEALKLGVKEIALFTATSDEFTKKNINCTVDESFAKMLPVAQMAREEGLWIRAYVSTAFGCPYAGEIPLAKLLDVTRRLQELGAHEISVGDTIGVATPKQVYQALQGLKQVVDVNQLAMHFHDTRGMALTNIMVSLEEGITIFDSSAGGLGGCPYAKGATGNVATEDVIYLMESLGIETGIKLKELTQASGFMLDILGKETTSKFLKAYLKAGK